MKIKSKIKNLIENYRFILSIIFGIFIALGIKLEFVFDTNFLGFTSSENDIMFLLFGIGICVLIYYASMIKEKRLWIVSIFVGIIFSICYYLGEIQNDYIYTFVPTTKKFILYSLVKLVVYWMLFTSCIAMLFEKLPILARKFDTKKEWNFFTNNKKSFFIIALIFFISYIPFFLHYFPGNINTDNIGSLYQITGLAPYSNFQPLLYTLIFGGIWNLGKAIFGTSTAGIALYVVFQMICTSLVFSTILYYMAKRKVSLKWRIITFLILILNPLNGWFVVRCEKGMLFHLCLILVIIGIIDIIHEKEEFFKKKWKPVLLGIITILMVLIRNNGIYALILTLPFLIWACKKIWKQVVILFGITLVLVFTIQGPIYKALNIEYSKPGEVLTIPMQQFARITKYDSDRLSDEDKAIIQKYFPVSLDKLANDYVPWKSDSTKANFSADAFIEDKWTFILQYFKFAFKFPVQTISSLVFNTGINYSPNFNEWKMTRMYGTETEDAYVTVGGMENEIFRTFITSYPIEEKTLVNFSFLDKLNEKIVNGNMPIVSMLVSNIGFYFWGLILCFAYCLYKKQYRNIVMLLPILGLWITAIAGPMSDLRYVYPMFLTVPIFIGIIIRDCKIEKENENER